MAYQVRRSEFDHVLIRNAARRGADGDRGMPRPRRRVARRRQRRRRHGAVRRRRDGALRRAHRRSTRRVATRSSRTSSARRSATRQHNSSALYGHFENAERLPGKLEGNITIFWFAHGWFWFIPLSDGATSVGAVCWPYYLKTRPKDRSVDDFFLDTIALCPRARGAAARRATARRCRGDRQLQLRDDRRRRGPDYLLLGDAFAFVDPVFSSGVYPRDEQRVRRRRPRARAARREPSGECGARVASASIG